MKRAGRGLMFLTPAVRRGSAIVSHSTSQLLPRRTAWLHLPVYTISLTLHTMMPISSQSKGQCLSPHSHDTACGSVYLSAYSYLHQGRGHTIRSICLSFCLSVCLCAGLLQSNQPISSYYDWAYQTDELINIWWWWCGPGYGFRITFPLPSPLPNRGF